MAKTISSRLAAAESHPDVIAARHRQQLIERFNSAMNDGTAESLIESLYDADLEILQVHLNDGEPETIDWINVMEDDFELIARNKISTAQLRAKYPLQEETKL
ncbi:MAG: hypothetical protein WCK54_18345 [Desulfuromonadales bacterium]